MPHLVAIVGTNAKLSYNRRLLQFMKTHFEDQAQIQLQELVDLPAFSENISLAQAPQIQTLIDTIKNADGVIIATPEYDHAIPAVLKSALEWLGHTSTALKAKPVMVVGASYGPQGSARAQLHLRQILSAPDIQANTLSGNEFLLGNVATKFDESGRLTDRNDIQILVNCVDDFLNYLVELKH